MDGNCQEWYQLCLRLIGIIIFLIAALLVVVIMSYKYSLKLEKGQVKLKKEIEQVERVNGKEKRDIAELQSTVKKLQEKLTKYE